MFLAVPAIVIFVWLFYPTEARRLRSDILSLRRAVEDESVERVVEYLDLGYGDVHDLTYDEIVTVLERFFEEVDSIRVQTSNLEVSIDSAAGGGTVFARCSLGLRVVARYEGERVLAFGGLVKPSAVRAWFRKVDGKYKVYRTEY